MARIPLLDPRNNFKLFFRQIINLNLASNGLSLISQDIFF